MFIQFIETNGVGDVTSIVSAHQYIDNTHPALTREGVDVYPSIGHAYIFPSSDQDITMQEMGLSAMCTLFTSEPAGDTNIVKKVRAASAFSLQGEHTEEKKADLQPHLLAIAKQRPGSQEFFNIKGKPSLHLITFIQTNCGMGRTVHC